MNEVNSEASCKSLYLSVTSFVNDLLLYHMSSYRTVRMGTSAAGTSPHSDSSITILQHGDIEMHSVLTISDLFDKIWPMHSRIISIFVI